MTPVQREILRRAIRREMDSREVRKSDIVTTSAIGAGTEIEIQKTDEEQRLFFGFAKFSEDPMNRGHYYVDRQGDIVETSVLEKAAYEYVLKYRDGGTMHKTGGDATLIESFMVTPEKLSKMGLPPDSLPAGWWVGFKMNEVPAGQEDPWDKIKSGDYSAFSIEGMGRRVPAAPIEHGDPVDYGKGLDWSHGQPVVWTSPYATNGITPSVTFDTSTNTLSSSATFAADFYTQLSKHKGEDHPESSHGNRLFSDEAEAVGDLMKKLKTRFKRTDATTLKSLRDKFARASGEKATLNHDQVVAELARRNIIRVKDIKFKSKRFKSLRDEVLAAITAELKELADAEE